MGVRFEERDHGYRRMRQNLKNLKGSYTKVGVQEGAKAEDSSDLVMDEHVPERSFMRSSFDENRDKLDTVIAAEADAVMLRGKDPLLSLAQIGEFHTGQIQAKIHSHPPPPNAPSTVEAKGSTGTLVDSGTLAQSIRHVEVLGGKPAGLRGEEA
jgi:hypothetical protein